MGRKGIAPHCLGFITVCRFFYLIILYEYQLYQYNTDILAYPLIFSKKVLPLKCHETVQNNRFFWTMSIL